MPVKKLLADQAAYSMTFWAVFIGLVLIPIMTLSIELSRYFTAKAEMGKAADAAALAAAVEINQRTFVESGELVPTAQTWAWAQNAASLNSATLRSKDVFARVSGIEVDDPGNTVRVRVSANLKRLFPSFMPDITVSETGLAEVRAVTKPIVLP